MSDHSDPRHDTNAYTELAAQTVDAVEGISGEHPGSRRAHAKGICCRAVFKSSGLAAGLTTAPHLQQAGTETEAFVRFSGSSTDPRLADLLSPGKGLGVRFRLPGGTDAVLTAVTLPVFFARTPESFLDMIRELNRFKDGGLDAVPAALALAKHFPEVKASLLASGKLLPPASYAGCRFYAIHAFHLADASGRRRPVKFEWMPDHDIESLPPGELLDMQPDYLEAELVERLSRGPVRYRLHIVLGQDGDPTDDPTRLWPDERERIDAGTLEVTEVKEEAEDRPMDPVETGPGIEPSDDPILRFRSPVYGESWRRRHLGE